MSSTGVVSAINSGIGFIDGRREKPSDGPVVLSFAEFVGFECQPRETVLIPWLNTGSLNLVYAGTGVGKTWFCLELMHCLVSGGVAFGRWPCTKPKKVLYIDGEMTTREVTERLSKLVRAQDIAAELIPNASFLSADVQQQRTGSGLKDLYSSEGRSWLEPSILEHDVVILDNIGCLWFGDENKSVEWAGFLSWLRSLKSKGATIILVHHAGKTDINKDRHGDLAVRYRGSSRIAEPMDTIIALHRPSNYEQTEGARFEVHFRKNRSLYGADVEPFVLSLNTEADSESPWIVSAVPGRENTFEAAIASGHSKRQIMEDMNISKATYYRKLKELGREQIVSETIDSETQS